MPRVFPLVGLSLLSWFPSRGGEDLTRKAEQALAFARVQAIRALESLGDSLAYPRSSGRDGQWTYTPADDWTSGFFPGLLWYLAGASQEPMLGRAAVRWTAGLEAQQWNRTTHDLGFMMFCSYGNGLRVDTSGRYRRVLLQSAATLARRFNPRVGCIKSWDWNAAWQFPVIVDNMMNLELLFWASKNGGGPALREMAVTHALTTMRHHLRPDGSTFHVVNFDTGTGAVLGKFTHQGATDSSVWARGQAWSVYGFTMTFRETGDARFLDAARLVTKFFLDHLPPDHVPYWDFRAPNIPEEPRDVSAAAIVTSALLELSTLVPDGEERRSYRHAAETLLGALTSSPWLARGTASPGILNHATGNKPGGKEIDVSLIYADYYMVEALLRYQKLNPR
jgi:hypothetical protein